MRMLLSILCLGLPLTAAADAMRCGKWVVDETVSVEELVAKCGEPGRKDVRTEDVMGRNAATGAVFKTGTQTIEHWLYQRSAGSLPMQVTIVDGRIRSISRAE